MVDDNHNQLLRLAPLTLLPRPPRPPGHCPNSARNDRAATRSTAARVTANVEDSNAAAPRTFGKGASGESGFGGGSESRTLQMVLNSCLATSPPNSPKTIANGLNRSLRTTKKVVEPRPPAVT